MTTKKLIGGAAILVAVFLAVPALAHFNGGGNWGGHMMGGGYGNHMGPGYGPGHMMGYGYGPGLNETQSQEVNEARSKFFKETSELRQKLALKEQELNALSLNPKASKDDLLAKLKEVNELRGELETKGIQFQAELQKNYPGRERGYGYGPGACWN